jgi:hypothetical protein
LRDDAPHFAAAGITPVFVVQARPDQLAESTGPLEGIVVVPDPKSVTHKAIGLRNVALRKMVTRAMLAARKRAVDAGHAQSWARTFGRESDTLRNPGAAIVDADGTLRWVHRGQSVEDLPSPMELLELAKGSAAR